jgi:asparagine synthase (glutamine-hydrolysing)
MPGILGIIGQGSRDENASILHLMVNSMLHEQFYTSGTYVNDSLGLWSGWIGHEGAFDDCSPAWNESKDVCLIFSGEEFADQEDIGRLATKGHEFDATNASYLVHWYEERGLEFLERLNGRFSGLLVDLREQRTVLFNDRYGFNRIYFHQGGDKFYFSSEAKSLLRALPALRRLDLRSLGEWSSCGCALQNRTLFSDVSLLPGGAAWTFSPGGRPKKTFYFSKEGWEQQPPLNGSAYYERLRDTFKRVLPKYTRDSRRIAISLTGGIDGRMIMSWARLPPGRLPCYTFGSMYHDCVDVQIGRQVAGACGQPHDVITVGHDFLRGFPALAEKAVYVSDGALDAAGAVELYVNTVARGIAPLRLTGNYGSEILRGNIPFRPGSPPEGLFAPEFASLVREAAATYQAERQGHRLSFIAFKQVPWHHYSRLAVESSQLTPRSPFLDNDLVALMYTAPPDLAVSNAPSLRLIAEGNPALSRIPTDRGLLYRPIPLVTTLLHVFRECTFKAEYACDYGMPQWLAGIDRSLAPLNLARIFLGRHKFYHFRVWYRDELSRYLQDILLDSRTLSRPYWSATRVKDLARSHIGGHRNYTREIHQLLTIELIHRLLIERP